VSVAGFDIVRDYRRTREAIGLVPQEVTTDVFTTVWSAVSFSRGIFGKPKSPERVEKVLKDLSLWEKKDAKILTLSGGMKRRLLIAKAIAHEPEVLFLDEPSAGVDVELRADLWRMVRRLRDSGVTIILTTHYIEEAEEMADRIGVINRGEIVLIEEKRELMRKLGSKELILHLATRLNALPSALTTRKLTLSEDGLTLTYSYDTRGERTGITTLLNELRAEGIAFRDIETKQTSLEEIFVDLVRGGPQP
jgi:ABC-2 type transport system ATP-binding protein